MHALMSKLATLGVVAGGLGNTFGDTLDGLTSSGTTQSDAFESSTAILRFTTVADGSGVKLDNGSKGDSQVIINDGSGTLMVYPPVGQNISTLPANTGFSMAPGEVCIFSRITNELWFVTPGLGGGLSGFAQVADYAALRRVSRRISMVMVTGYMAAAEPSGIAGLFVRVPSDTTSADDGGVVIVGNDGTRWKRVYEGRAVNVLWFGAVGDGVVDDTPPIQAAVNAYSHVFFPNKRFKIQTSAAGFNYGNSSTPVYRAIDINKSNFTITAEKGATILLRGVDDPGPNGEINYAFSTAKNMVLGTLSNISISGLEFDFNPTGVLGTTYRSFHIVGVRGVFLDNLYLYSSGGRFGATITLQNCEQVRFTSIRMRNVTQGMNFSYVDDVEFDDIMLDYFSEGIDFDRMVSRFKGSNITFTSTFGPVSGQCWDLNSVRDSTITGMSAYRCTNTLLINFKHTTPQTYADYVNYPTWPVGYPGTVVYTPSRNVTVNGVKIRECAQDQTCIFVGDDFDTDPGVLNRDISISDLDMVDSGGIELRMAINISLRRLSLIGARPPTTANYAAIVALKGSRLNARSSVSMDDVTIKAMAVSQDAIRLSECDYGYMNKLYIEDFPLDAVDISAPTAGSSFSITNSTFTRTDTVLTGIALRIGSVTVSDASLAWDNNFITQYTTPCSVAGVNAGLMLPSKKYSFGRQAFTAGTVTLTLHCDSVKTAYFGMVKLAAMTAGASAVNFVQYNLRNQGVSVCSSGDQAGFTTGTMLDIGFVPPEAAAEVPVGAAMYLECAAQGAGRTLEGFMVNARLLEYTKI